MHDINPRKLKYEKACGLWSSFLPSPELEANSPPHIHENMVEKPQNDILKLHIEEKLESTADVSIETKELLHRDGDNKKLWEEEASIPLGKVGRIVGEIERCTFGQTKFSVSPENTETKRGDENENNTNDSGFCVPDDEEVIEEKTTELPVNGHSSYSKEKVQHQTCDPGLAPDVEVPNDQSSKSQSFVGASKEESKESVSGQIKPETETKTKEVVFKRSCSKDEVKESVSGQIKPETETKTKEVVFKRSCSKDEVKESVSSQIKQRTDTETEEVAVKRSYVLGYFAGKLSEVYKGAGRRLQGTQDILRNVRASDLKDVLSQYVTKMSKELPLIHHMQLKPEPEPRVLPEDKVCPVGQSGDFTLMAPGLSGWPDGSMSSLKDACPVVFKQGLVQMPPALSRLQSLSSQSMLEKLGSVAPQVDFNELLSIFWLETANRKQPIPKPGCLLLSSKDITVLSTNSDDTIALLDHLNLLEIKEVQISLAGQHVRLIGCTEDTVLAVFTHNKGLTQEFCKSLLKGLSPGQFSEGTGDHPLLSDDLMVLSLDWTLSVPDIALDDGVHVTSRFKRVLADLLYIVHGNMDDPGKPSLADVRPLLYTSVKLKNSTDAAHQDAISQFLLTDTHVALLREDGVFHPVPRGSSVVPAQPQFQGLRLRKRSDIRCVLVRQSDNCLVVELMFTAHKSSTPGKKLECVVESELPAIFDSSDSSDPCNQGDSWKLTFGCTSEAVMLVNDLCT
ncbi:uncharacterized protein LOC117940491 [Etheostoma cragini]|uniref:uncharacterized protein LOC117940491 n=1 Tax=Etheostoma cragini TaxID=417921 RepID=UPI00155E4573|nr:uncharacterized protein LOC117940491 [Etheostoma cragini]XP_034721645.1 uncharacterized protein LOC117940491 [Etheostoma cragini]